MKTYEQIASFLEKWIIEYTATTQPLNMDCSYSIVDYGVDSGGFFLLAQQLSQYIEKNISPILIYQAGNIQSLIHHIISGKDLSVTNLNTFDDLDRLLHQKDIFEPIAVIGMSCRFPSASTIDMFWNLLTQQKTAISPPSIWHQQHLDLESIPTTMHPYFRAGYLENLDQFDAQFFKISKLNAVKMGPLQRILLEESYTALENANLNLDAISKKSIGVTLGIYSSTTVHQQDQQDFEISDVLGGLYSIAANNISYYYNLKGPSLAIDTACSSSLHAILVACHLLHNQSASMMLAGGVHLILNADKTLAYARSNMLSPNATCSPFDAKANGFVRGEGVAWLVLKPYEDAVRDGDSIISVIIGGTMNQDGKTTGITSPNLSSQQQLFVDACASASIRPADVQYIEAHGTGTQLGDPIEMIAMNNTFGYKRPQDTPYYLGSVKANIGHLESAAGMASVIKTSLCIKHKIIPGNPNFSALSPLMHTENSAFIMPDTTINWPNSHPAMIQYAGVSSFSIGGSNAHLILTNQEGMEKRSRNDKHQKKQQSDLMISRLKNQLSLKKTIIFVYSGTGSEWPTMGREMYLMHRIFRDTMNDAHDIIQRIFERSLIDFLLCESKRKFVHNQELIFPCLVAIQIALTKVLEHVRIFPATVLGHSLGEYAAAYIAGALNFEEAIRFSYQSACFHTENHRQHAMIMIFASKEMVLSLLTPYTGSIFLAGVLNKTSILVSGRQNSLEALINVLKQHNIYFRKVQTPLATHIPPLTIPPFIRNVEARCLTTPNIAFYSSMLGQQLIDHQLSLKELLYCTIKPIQFLDAVSSLIANVNEQTYTFLEVNAHPIMKNSIYEILSDSKRSCDVFHTLVNDKR